MDNGTTSSPQPVTAGGLSSLGRALVRRHRRPLWAAVLFMLLQTGFDLLRPWPLKVAVDSGLGDQPLPAALSGLGAPSPTSLAVLAAGASVAVVLGAAGAGYLSETMLGAAAERMCADLRESLVRRLLALPLSFHDRQRSTELVTRLTTDVYRVGDAAVVWFDTVVPEALAFVGVLVVLVLLDPTLALAAVAVTPVLAGVTVLRRRAVRRAQHAARDAAGDVATTAADLLHNVRAVQAFGMEGRALEAFRVTSDRVVRTEVHALRTEARYAPTGDVTLAAGTGLVLCLGVALVSTGRLTLGTLLVALSYVATLYAPLRALTRLAGVLGRGAASRDRIAALLSTEPPASAVGAAAPGRLSTGITLDRLHFGYDAAAPVLDDVSVVLPARRMTAVVGESGSGKSTLLSLLLRLYEPDAGAIRWDGTDLAALDVPALRSRLALVPQDSWLLDATVRDNVTAGWPAATDVQVQRAAVLAGLDQVVARLPHGWDTVVGERGLALSGGQRKRVALARALVRPADVLLLDEPTSGLDDTAAEAIRATLLRLAREHTVVVATHDTDLARLADHEVRLGPARLPVLSSVLSPDLLERR